jgi:HAD superfamily hydrolase (TIGR01484 family)
MKELIIFDLDGTLAESKAPMDPAMAALFGDLLVKLKVAVISGGAWPQFEKQVLARLPAAAPLERLSILPTCGTKFYRFEGEWIRLYSEDFSPEDRELIIQSLNTALDQSGFRPDRHWGDLIEDRGSQITLSVLGQEAPLDAKSVWDPDFAKRRKMKAILEPLIPGFAINMGGSTSIDITGKGIDKAYGILKLRKILGIPIQNMLFVGDALFPGGNDYPAKDAGVATIQVGTLEETKRIIEAVIACVA